MQAADDSRQGQDITDPAGTDQMMGEAEISHQINSLRDQVSDQADGSTPMETEGSAHVSA